MEYEKIRQSFFLILGEEELELDYQRLMLCNSLCSSAQKEVGRMVKPEISAEMIAEYSDELENLAAAKAFYDLTLLEKSVHPKLKSGGDMEFEREEKNEKAQLFYQQKRKAAEAVLKNSDFFFGVTGL